MLASLIVMAFGLILASTAAQPIGNCDLQEDKVEIGAGCCLSVGPQGCGGLYYEYSASCGGACPVGQGCVVFESQTKLIYVNAQCSGSCEGTCTIHEYQGKVAMQPTKCTCAPIQR